MAAVQVEKQSEGNFLPILPEPLSNQRTIKPVISEPELAVIDVKRQGLLTLWWWSITITIN